jgi:hypothetical protein
MVSAVNSCRKHVEMMLHLSKFTMLHLPMLLFELGCVFATTFCDSPDQIPKSTPVEDFSARVLLAILQIAI